MKTLDEGVSLRQLVALYETFDIEHIISLKNSIVKENNILKENMQNVIVVPTKSFPNNDFQL